MAGNRNPMSHQQNHHGRKKSGGSPQGAAGKVASNLDETEISLIVCELFLGGMSCREIVTLMRETYGVEITQRAPLKCLRIARQRGWLNFNPPSYLKLSTQIKKKYTWLEGLDVVHAPTSKHVAMRGALVLRRLVKKNALDQDGKRTVHIGMAGGVQMRDLAWEFAQLLREPAEDWPDEIVIHAMVSGVKLGDPTIDPKTMFLSLGDDHPDLPVKLRVVSFPGPGLVDSDQIDVDRLKSWDDIQTVIAEAEHLDIIVTSAGNWEDEHCVLSQTMKSSNKTYEKLVSEGVVGDYLWCPFNINGPIKADISLSIMTLVDLDHLPEFIARGNKVLFLLGPCDECSQPKPAILKVLLDLHDHLFTHLVVDSRTARNAVKVA